MYDKKYRVANISYTEESSSDRDLMLGAICYPAYLKEGERGWILFEVPNDPFSYMHNHMHRLHTSPISSVEYGGSKITVKTRNTVYTLEETD